MPSSCLPGGSTSRAVAATACPWVTCVCILTSSVVRRLSNFLLWQSAYAEFVFTDTLWPDFGPEELRTAIEEYARRRRRFGGR